MSHFVTFSHFVKILFSRTLQKPVGPQATVTILGACAQMLGTRLAMQSWDILFGIFWDIHQFVSKQSNKCSHVKNIFSPYVQAFMLYITADNTIVF